MKTHTLTATGPALSGLNCVAVKLQGHEGVDGLFDYRLILKRPEHYTGLTEIDLIDLIGKAANRGIHKHEAGAPGDTPATPPSETVREDYATTLDGASVKKD